MLGFRVLRVPVTESTPRVDTLASAGVFKCPLMREPRVACACPVPSMVVKGGHA